MFSKIKRVKTGMKHIFKLDVFRAMIFRIILKLYLWFTKKVFMKARTVFYYVVLLKHFEHNPGYKIKVLAESAEYVGNRLIHDEPESEEHDNQSIRFGNSIYAKHSDDEDIRYALIEYLKISRFYFDDLTDAFEDEVRALDSRLNQLGVSDRIDSSKTYASLYGNLNKKSKILRKQIKAASKEKITEVTWKQLGGQKFSFELAASILAILTPVYIFASFLYVHIILREFGLNSTNYITLIDYPVLALPELYKVIIPLILGGIILYESIYVEINRVVIESELEKTQPRSKAYVILFALAILAIHEEFLRIFIMTGDIDMDEVNDLMWFYAYMIFFILVRFVPFEKIFSNGYFVRLLTVSCLILVTVFIREAKHAAEDAESPPTSKWEYVIINEVLKSDEYSLLFESSKYVIFHHRKNKATRIVPIDDVREIITYMPKT